MHKILLTLLLLATLFFPSSEILAACPAGEREYCPCGTSADTFGNCANASGGTAAPICRSTPFNCAAPAAAPAGGTATKVASTSGSGQRCWLDPKSPDYGKPVPAGHVPGIDSSTGKEYPTGILTAIGCVPTEPKALVEGLLKFATLAAGGIAFLLMILGALGLITAEGNPEAIKASQERFYSAIIGLLIIIFAVLLMQVIGVDILGLPDFRKPANPT